MPPWASWSGSSLPSSKLILPEISVVWDLEQGHQRLGAPRAHLTNCTIQGHPPAPAAAICIVAHNGPHSIYALQSRYVTASSQ